MNRYTGLCLSIIFGSALMTGCTGTTMPVIYGEQQGANGQRLLVPLATATDQTGLAREKSRAMNGPMDASAATQSVMSIAPDAVPFLSPAPIRLLASSEGSIEIRNDGVTADSGAPSVALVFGDLSPALQAFLFPSCSAERMPTFLSARR